MSECECVCVHTHTHTHIHLSLITTWITHDARVTCIEIHKNRRRYYSDIINARAVKPVYSHRPADR